MSRIHFVEEIPIIERMNLCSQLDSSGWEDIASSVEYFDKHTIDRFRVTLRNGGSAASSLLDELSFKNTTISDLYGRIATVKLYEALKLLDEFVPQALRDRVRGFPPAEQHEAMAASQTADLPVPVGLTLPVEDFMSTASYMNSDGSCDIDSSSGQSMASCSNNLSYGAPNYLSGAGMPLNEKTLNVYNKPLQPPARINGQRQLEADNKQLQQATAIMNTQHFPYNEIKAATNSFDRKSQIGCGGFGCVYKGYLKNTPFAIKQIKSNNLHGSESGQQHHMSEIQTLTRFRHENIIQLCGYSMDGPELCLIFQFMPNGSLQDRLACKNNTPALTWRERHSILKGAARGIQYLHTVDEEPLVHGDIKSANILLDDSLKAKVADFGLSKQKPSRSQTTVTCLHERVFVSEGYLPQEFFSCYHYSIETDSFSFGVVIFETCTGLTACIKNEGDIYLTDYVKRRQHCLEKLRDPLARTWPSKQWQQLLDLGTDLTGTRKKDRPTMQKVLHRLDMMESSQVTSGGSSPYLVSGSSSVLSTREHPPFNQPASGCSSVLRNSEANHVYVSTPMQLQLQFDSLSMAADSIHCSSGRTPANVSSSEGKLRNSGGVPPSNASLNGRYTTCEAPSDGVRIAARRSVTATLPANGGGGGGEKAGYNAKFQWQLQNVTKMENLHGIDCTESGTFATCKADEDELLAAVDAMEEPAMPAGSIATQGLDETLDTDTKMIRRKLEKKQPAFLDLF